MADADPRPLSFGIALRMSNAFLAQEAADDPAEVDRHANTVEAEKRAFNAMLITAAGFSERQVAAFWRAGA